MNPLSDEITVAVICDAATAHETLSEAMQHVAAQTGTLYDDLWFRATREGVFLLVGRADERSHDVPIAWLIDGVSYQTAKSRGDLESVHDFF